MRESGDPQLLGRYRAHQELRLTQEGFSMRLEPCCCRPAGRARMDGHAAHEFLEQSLRCFSPARCSCRMTTSTWLCHSRQRRQNWLYRKPSGARPVEIRRNPRSRPSGPGSTGRVRQRALMMLA
jgi:hypothetical protein